MSTSSRSDRARGERPPLRRALGQYHLRDGRVCRPLVDHLRLTAGATIVEIGPGGGALTRELLARGARVAAVELDPLWAFALRSLESAAHGSSIRVFSPQSGQCASPIGPGDEASSGQRLPVKGEPERSAAGKGDTAAALAIVVADALTLNWAQLPAGWRVAGNLPYNVGTAIVERLLRSAPAGTRAGFLLQREVVERMVAGPGDEAYGALSLLVAARARAERLAIVRPGAFVPRPAVDSAFLGLEIVPPPLPEPQLLDLERLVRAAFAQRRKSLRNALGAVYGREAAAAALAEADIDSGQRAEELGLEEFLALRMALGNS